MASLSVSRKTSPVAGPLGTLPRFGENTCAQDAVVAPNTTIKMHSVLIPKALPIERRALSLSCITIGFCHSVFFNFVLCFVSLFRESQSCVPLGFNQNRESVRSSFGTHCGFVRSAFHRRAWQYATATILRGTSSTSAQSAVDVCCIPLSTNTARARGSSAADRK